MIDRRHCVAQVVGLALTASAGMAKPSRMEAIATLTDFAQKSRLLYHDPAKGAALYRRLLTAGGQGEFRAAATPGQLANALNRLVHEVTADGHFMVMHGAMGAPAVPPTAPHSPIPPLSPAELQFLRSRNFGFGSAEMLAGNVGRLEVHHFYRPAPEVRARLASAMDFLADTSALIIDLADNPGGDPHAVALLLSYFFDRPPFVVNRFLWRQFAPEEFLTSRSLEGARYGEKRPLFVRISPATYSAAEEFAYDIQALKRGVIVGEVSGGGANHALPVPIAGGFVAYIPQARAENPITRTNWEAVGVAPDVEIGTSESLRTAHRLALQAVIEGGDAARADVASAALSNH